MTAIGTLRRHQSFGRGSAIGLKRKRSPYLRTGVIDPATDLKLVLRESDWVPSVVAVDVKVTF